MFEKKPPIRSTQEDVAELADELDRFVIALAEQIDAIQDAELVGLHAEVSQLTRLLGHDAERLGYPGLSQCAKTVAAAAAAAAAADEKTTELQEAVIDLTDLVQRIRRGHRGAA
jgi:hypothetical protein